MSFFCCCAVALIVTTFEEKISRMKTGLLIKELRLKKGLTQEELAARTEVSTRTIQRIENGDVDPRAYTLQMIAKALEVDFSLFAEEELKEETNKDDRMVLAMIHLSGLLLLFFPTVLIWSNKKNKVKGITDHFYDVISFQLTLWLMAILPGIALYFFFKANGIINKAPYMILIGFLFGVVISVTNTISVLQNKPYKRFSFFKSKNKNSE